ncbi:hypothetical protein OJF2_34810 [Aquisphaera giovannonii]|uniref:REase AHJR-like domain-containing protein n=1 Tax=Aquisphaera giovannonii TaxID=406548 RepID=A0A5B9W2U9_9BACT|nr:hypothetical protein [Aquisphaera giovannonii]QEH34936.1 hypothetical protein OJF2_34810 [Aquisphaera giovannonii]
MDQESLAKIARRYRDEGYEVVVAPRPEQLPPFLAGFRVDIMATRGSEGVVIEVKLNRMDLARDADITRLAEIVHSEPGWKLDLVVLESETQIEKATQDAAEPSDDQLFQILRTADELADKGHAPFACVIAWSGLEAAMRRPRGDVEVHGRATPSEMMRALYSNGVLSREQFEQLRESYKVRSQVVHGLVPGEVAPDLVRHITATARYLVKSEGAALSLA